MDYELRLTLTRRAKWKDADPKLKPGMLELSEILNGGGWAMGFHLHPDGRLLIFADKDGLWFEGELRIATTTVEELADVTT